MPHWLFLSLAIVAEVIGTSFLKSTEGFTRLAPSLIVALAYGSAFYFLALALKSIPVGIAYAIWAGVGTALIVLVGIVALDQKLDAAALIGVGLIFAGVLIINLFSANVPPPL